MNKNNKIYENVNFPIIAFQRKELSGTTNNIFVDTSSIPSSDGKWKASSIAIADDSVTEITVDLDNFTVQSSHDDLVYDSEL